MSDLNVAGMAIAPAVVETIVSLAVKDVEGVAGLVTSGQSGLRGLLPGSKQAAPAIEVDVDEEEKLHVSIRLEVKSGYVLPDLAANVRRAVADAVAMQVGIDVGSVDIYVDEIKFAE